MITVGSLFAGIGGLELGLEWTGGFKTVWQVEKDEYCRKVLQKHWPEVQRYERVEEVHAEGLCPLLLADPERNGQLSIQGRDLDSGIRASCDERREQTDVSSGSGSTYGTRTTDCEQCLGPVDLICGGFPCQPVSVAGKQLAQRDDRWLWPEFARIVRELRPRYVLVENVPGLLVRGMGDVLRDLAALGYDAEWESIPAAALGAPHLRYRVFLLAHARRTERGSIIGGDGAASGDRCEGSEASGGSPESSKGRRGRSTPDAFGAELRHEPRRWNGQGRTRAPIARDDGTQGAVADAIRPICESRAGRRRVWQSCASDDSGWWAVEPGVGRVADGVPARVDRLRALGNAVVPPVAEWIGHRILDAEQGRAVERTEAEDTEVKQVPRTTRTVRP